MFIFLHQFQNGPPLSYIIYMCTFLTKNDAHFSVILWEAILYIIKELPVRATFPMTYAYCKIVPFQPGVWNNF